MLRPSLNPSFLEDPEPPVVRPRRRLWRAAVVALKRVWRLMMWRPFGTPRVEGEEPQQTPFMDVCRALLHRLAFAPIVLTMLIAALVWSATHPRPVDAGATPASLGIYYEPVAMAADDGQLFEGWLVPAIDAKRVISQQERVLRTERAAVVLVHDHGQGRQQMLPLVRPLHEAGLVVLVVGLRGEGTPNVSAQTFGLREAADVKAAVEMLRRRPFVDADRIAVIGSGAGATAALLAAAEDPGIVALVLDTPFHDSQQVLPRIGPADDWLAMLRPMCKWAFEFSFGVDADDLNLSRHQQVLNRMPVLMIDNGEAGPGVWRQQSIEQVKVFLYRHLASQAAMTTASAE